MASMAGSLAMTAVVIVLLIVKAQTAQGACNNSIDLMLVVDNSATIGAQSGAWSTIRQYLVSVVQFFSISPSQTQVGCLTFNDRPTQQWNLTAFNSVQQIVNAINSDVTFPLQGTGNSSIAAALQYVCNTMFASGLGARSSSEHAILLVTSSYSNVNTEQAIPQARNCWFNGVKVFVVGVTSNVDVNQIRAVASPPQVETQQYWLAPDFSSLNSSALTGVQSSICSPPKPSLPACQIIDLVFVLPTIGVFTNWLNMVNFVNLFVSSYLIVGTQNVRVSVVTYNSQSYQIPIGLNDYSFETSLLTAINGLQFVNDANPDPIYGLLGAINAFNSTTKRPSSALMMIMILYVNTNSPDQEMTYLNTLQTLGVNRLAIAFSSPNFYMNELLTVASSAAGAISAIDSSTLISNIDQISTALCNGQGGSAVCPRVADIVLCLQSSTGILALPPYFDQNWYVTLLNFARQIVTSFPYGPNATQFGVVVFNENIVSSYFLNQYANRNDLLTTISELQNNGGDTDISNALNYVRTTMFSPSNGARAGVPKILIMVTNGAANRNAAQTIPQANLTKADGIEIFAVGITTAVVTTQITQIVSPPVNQHYFYVSNVDQINSILQTLVDNSCKRAATFPTTTMQTTTPMTTTTPTTTTTRSTSTSTSTTSTSTSTTTTATTTSSTTSSTSTTTTPTTTTRTTTTPTTTTTTPSTTTTTPSLSSIVTTTIKTNTTTTTPSIPGGTSSCAQMVDVCFLVARSSNINKAFFTAYLLEFLQSVASKLNIDSGSGQVSAITFSDTAQVEFYLNSYSTNDGVQRGLFNLTYGGTQAALSDAFNLARTSVFTSANGARLNMTSVAKIVIVITSQPSNNQTTTLAEAAALRAMGVQIITIGIGSFLNAFELTSSASYPFSSNSLWVNSTTNIVQLSNVIAKLVCSNDVMCNSSTCQNNGTCSTSLNQIYCNCTAGYAGPNCQYVSNRGSDVVFAVDVSISVQLTIFQTMISYVQTLVTSLYIDGPSTDYRVSRVGLLTYGQPTVIQFQLNTYISQLGLLQALNTIPYSPGVCDVADAIRTARTAMFTPANGQRQNYTSVLVLMIASRMVNQTAAYLEAMAARQAGITIIVIIIGNVVQFNDVVPIASNPAANNIIIISPVTTPMNVTVIIWFLSIIVTVPTGCNSSNPCQNGAYCTSLIGGGVSCSPCPLGYTGAFCERPCSGMMDIAFVLHSAGTVRSDRWHFMADFVESVVNQLDIGPNRTQVAVMYYSDNPYIGFGFNQSYNKQNIVQLTRMLPYIGGKTNTYAALDFLTNTLFQPAYGARTGATRFAVLVVNGQSTLQRSQVPMAGTACHNAGITVLTVAADRTLQNSAEMFSIASPPFPRNMFVTPTLSTVLNATAGVVAALCFDSRVCSSNPCQNGSTCVPKVAGYYCQCPQNFTGVNCSRQCGRQVDVIFVLDISGSVEDQYWPTINFAQAVSNGLDIDHDLARVGAVAYASAIVGQFSLSSYQGNRQAVLNAFNFYNQGGETNTAAALDEVRLNSLNASQGARDGVPKVVVLITDGYSNVNPQNTIPAAAALRQTNATVYAVGTSTTPQLSELNGAASNPSTTYVKLLPSADQINPVASSVLDSICSGDLISAQTNSTASNQP